MVNRRKVLQVGGVAALGLLAGGSFVQAKGKRKNTLQLGVIGTGSRGLSIMKILKGHNHIKLAACCDVLPFRLDEAAKATGAKPYTDYRKLLEHKGLDAVLIATPLSMHAQMAVDALQAGKHVYCEKTMAMGMSAIQEVIDTHKNSGLIFQTGHQYNSSELYQKVHKMIEVGYLGDITAFECQWNRNGDWRRNVPDPKWERIINWRMYKEYSGGLTAELCSHQIDFICRVLKESPKKITGFGGIDHWKDGRETFDNIHLLYEFPSGIDASFTCTTTNSFDDYRIKILGEKATIIMDYTNAYIHLEKKELKEYGMVDGVSGATITSWEKGEGAPIDASSQDITLQAVNQFYDAIYNDKPVYSTLKTGALTSKCVQMSLDALHEEKIAYWKDYPELTFG